MDNTNYKNISFKELTTLKIGGPVKEVTTVKTEEEIIISFQQPAFSNQPFLVIGSGSNLLVSDEGFSGLVIKNEIEGIEKVGNNLTAKSGTLLQDLVDFANDNGLAGLENLAGIPGTVGGAIYGNAGAYGQTISDHLVSVKILDPNSVIPANAGIQLSNQNTWIPVQARDDIKKLSQFSKNDCHFNYRDSIFKRNKNIVLEAVFALVPSDSETLKKISDETIKKREVKYPPGIKCPGSFFKNIPQDSLPDEILGKVPKELILYGKVSAGALLESVDAKGAREGNIFIAPYHANLFINEGGGKAQDFYNLAKIYSQKVYEKYRIRLEPEVQLINLPAL